MDTLRGARATAPGVRRLRLWAYDPDRDRKAAIKWLLDAGAPGDRSRLLREAQALAMLSHPNVVIMFEVGSVGAGVCMAMEHGDGTAVDAWTSRRRRSWREVGRGYAQAVRGLAAAHAAGLIHRDFKPVSAHPCIDDHVIRGRVAPADERAKAPRRRRAVPRGSCAGVPGRPGTVAHRCRWPAPRVRQCNTWQRW